MNAWWRSLGTGQRVAVAVVGAVVAANLLVSAIGSIVGSDPGGPASSAFGTGDDGLEAWADLLAADGRAVERSRTALADLELDPAGTVVVADPVVLDEGDVRALGDHLVAGGRLVVMGDRSAALVVAFTGVEVGRGSSVVGELTVWFPSEHTGAARELVGDRGGRWTDVGPLLPLAGDPDGRPVVVVGQVGEGTLVALADTDLLHNRNLARGDNAALALAIAGDPERPVLFAESVRARPGGFGAMPTSWRWMLAGLALALGAGLWSAGARFGPPEPPPVARRPPRRDHVEAVAAALQGSAGRSHPNTDPTRQERR